MCGRYTLTAPDPARIRMRFPVGEAVEIRPRFNVAPGDDVLAVTTDRDGRARGELLRWGLVPPWSKPGDTGLKMINARAETLEERPAYREAFKRFRCLVVADGFYEWRRQEAGPKQPFHIAPTDLEPFAFAGLWTVWRDERQTLRSCTIITTQAHGPVASLHDRMPVILPREAEEEWLHGSSPGRLLELVSRSRAETAGLRPVSTAVNDARHDAPDCLEDPVVLQSTLF
ncbi:MAG TPA: SOS response-associated peptidase [Solirubrobacteraceae bacterium]|jgi:putative SOS response-associated peptidase YedK|nr:SOS response-associated peptidase [Solirubrobacteraceae bacterium]